MNKEKLFQLRRRVNESFFKKSYPRERLLNEKGYRGTSL